MAQLAHISSQASYRGYMKEYDKEMNYTEILLRVLPLLLATSTAELTQSLCKTTHAAH